MTMSEFEKCRTCNNYAYDLGCLSTKCKYEKKKQAPTGVYVLPIPYKPKENVEEQRKEMRERMADMFKRLLNKDDGI